MAEIIQREGTWTFDADTVRIVPGRDKGVSLLRQNLGELDVPLGGLAGISHQAGKRGGRLRLHLRDGADPLLQVTGGRLDGPNDPYQPAVDPDRAGVAAATTAPAKYDPHGVELWGFKKDPLMALVGAAVAARLDQGIPAGEGAPAPALPPADDHDALLRRLARARRAAPVRNSG
jgi:hypothetical protein